MSNKKKIAILGYGTIGSGVHEIISGRDDMEVIKVLDIRTLEGTPAEKIVTDRIEDIIESDADVIVETMGGVDPAFEYICLALNAGKSVVTSNKVVVEAKSEEIEELAKKNGVKFFYEAAVGGGIPIIRVMEECLKCDPVIRIMGILNGTTNFILTQMSEKGDTYEEALHKAQRAGYAEADPSADVEGTDTCRKLAILASIMMGRKIHYEDIPCEGITRVTKENVEAAKKSGKKIKLVGYAEKSGDELQAYVSPIIVDSDNQIFSIDGVMNAVALESKYLGNSMYVGAGAGKYPTATAVVADIMHV